MAKRSVSKGRALGLAAAVALGFAGAAWAGDWSTFNGDLMAQKFATDTQITPANVKNLSVAWNLHTGDVSDGSGKIDATDWEATPLFVNNTVYVSTPFYRVFAVEPDTGRIKWIYNSRSTLKPLTQGPRTRGLAYWQAPDPVPGQPCQKVLYLGTMDAKIHAIDADTGHLCAGFGDHGILNVDQWNTINPKFPLSILQPPIVYKNMLIFGWAGKDWYYEQSPPGSVFGVDARTGQLKWTFNAIPENLRKTIGTANVWASMSVDPKAGIVYLPVSSPEANFYGGDRKEPIPYATSVTALNAETGQVIWSRQLVHHDVWDVDTNSAPVLVDLHKNGQVIPALVQSSKQGFLYVLNRMTGQPIYPMVEKPVPQSDVPGEKTSPTQPFVEYPKPTISDYFPGVFGLADQLSFGACSRQVQSLRYDGKFTPPSLKGSIAYPGAVGGVEWGGGAIDPTDRTYVVNSSSVPVVYQLVPRAEYDRQVKEGKRVGPPQLGSPYGAHLGGLYTWFGMPCWNPPYGTISAYNMDTGKLLWREPFGQIQKWGFYMPKSWGSVTLGGPVITKTGLVFIGASMDSRVRAIDIKTGKVLWKHQVQAPAVSIPASYTYKGRQYIVFTAGGNSILSPTVGDQLIAFALPKQ